MSKMLAKRLGDGMVRCLACNRYCVIREGNAGFCGVRANEGGKLKLVVHSKPAAVWVDPVEKKPFFHFLPGSKSFSLGTFGCNFSCSFCQNWDLSQAPHEARVKDPAKWMGYFRELVARCEDWPPERVVREALKNGCKSIAFTYSEPTIFTEYAIDVMKLARKKGLKGIYVTNGYESPECWDALKGHIDAANIDLKAYNQKFYTELCKVPDFTKVKESILYARKKGIWVEVTTLIIPGWNDKESEIKAEAEWLASIDPLMPWHVTAFHPDYKMLDTPSTPPESLVRIREIGKMAGLRYLYCGNVATYYSDYESTDCHSCGKRLITRLGYRITQDEAKAGRCRYCKAKIPGIWE
jgi:pyruvate formate lyase activating enzyme